MPPTLRRILIALAGALVLVTAAPAQAASEPDVARAAQACQDADLEPTSDNLGRIQDAVLCLHNEIRAQKRLPALRENARLREAALGHSRDMVRSGYFEHTAPGGRTMVDRILRARYVRRSQSWALGENLAWGTGELSTPRGALQAWMASPGHRANIMRASYRELGVGLVLGVPVSDAAGATYTVDFGVRR